MPLSPSSTSHRRRRIPRPRRCGCADRARRGLTLVECLVATVLLAFSAAAAATALSAAYQNERHARDQAFAIAAAEEVADAIAHLPFDSAAPVGHASASEPQPATSDGRLVGATLTRAAASANLLNDMHGLRDERADVHSRVFERSVEVAESAEFSDAAVAFVIVTLPDGSRVEVQRLLLPTD